MAVDKTSQISYDPQQWRKIFNSLVQMLQTQQTHLELLVKERKILENRIKIQYDRWVSDVHLLEDQVSQISSDLSQAELGRLLEAAKSDLIVGLKKKEGLLYKMKLECVEGDLEDFKSWFMLLTRECSEFKGKCGETDKGKGGNVDQKSLESTKEEQRSKILEGDVRKLKRAYEKLTSKNNSDVSALLSERDFVWNQFKKMEVDYTSLLKSKRAEVEQANGKIEKLLSTLEQLQSSNNEKDATIVRLKAKLDKLEVDMGKSNGEISRLSRELELLRNSRSALDTPVLNRCSTESSTCGLRSQKNGINDRKRTAVKKESAGSQSFEPVKNPEKFERGSKRRRVESMPSSKTPMLFSATFKVPKLKNSASSFT